MGQNSRGPRAPLFLGSVGTQVGRSIAPEMFLRTWFSLSPQNRRLRAYGVGVGALLCCPRQSRADLLEVRKDSASSLTEATLQEEESKRSEPLGFR